MNIVFRVDSSIHIGSGHLMRCLTLAGALRKKGVDSAFISRELPGNQIDLVEAKGFIVHRLPTLDTEGGFEPESLYAAWLGVPWEEDAKQVRQQLERLPRPEWLIVDSYAIDRRWEKLQRPLVGRIMVIDDFANRFHDCDILLDQNLFDDMQWRYDNLTPSGCRMFLGPRYALLRNEFIAVRRTLRERDSIIRHLLIFFGGSDPTNETEKALFAINQLNRQDINVDVVVGSANPNGDKIQGICSTMSNVTFHRQVTNMATLMAHSDLAIGAGGTTTWERCFLGLPTLIVVVADNQAKLAQAADRAGLARLVGGSSEVTVDFLAAAICEALRTPDALVEMSKHCLSFMGQRNLPVNNEILACIYEVT